MSALVSQPEHEQHPEHHVVSPLLYVGVFLALMVGTGLTVGVALIDLGIFNPILALTIAVLKASLVVLFFMHVKWSPRITALAICSAIFFFLVLLVLTSTDYITRSWSPQ
jgi:cytochrome c oxidase subunit 4